ncbi:MAG: serine protease [Rhodobacteraceae bacterium]|nr:serine protease [Paracoccaceae bacterium]
MLPKSYYTFSELSTLRQRGFLWLAKTLGGRFVHRQVSPAIVHVVGEHDGGEGSGIVFDKHHVLTCRHVVSDMRVASAQAFQGRTVTVEEVYRHETEDVAVIRIKEPLRTVPGLGFVDPMVSQKVYRFGHSRVPCSIGNSSPVMQNGEVTNELIHVIGNRELFLYSAISRPGDSGGAIVSDDGYVVGMTTELLDSRVLARDGEEVFSPHYAGIPSSVLARVVDEMELGVQIPFETYV